MPTVDALMSKHISNAITNKQTWGGIIYNVKAYGAKGDGVTDDTVAIQQAINAGSIIYFPDPDAYYKVTDAIIINESNKHLIGQSENTIIYNDTSNIVQVIDVAGTDTENIENITFENLTIRNGSSSTDSPVVDKDGITVEYAKNVTLKNCLITEIEGRYGFVVKKSEDIKIIGNTFYKNTYASCFIRAEVDGILVENNVFDTITSLTMSYSYHFATGNDAIGDGSAWYVRNLWVRNNKFLNNPRWEGIDCHGGEGIWIQDNYIENCAAGIMCQVAGGGYVSNPVHKDIFIENNVIKQGTGESPLNGIAVGGDTDSEYLRAKNIHVRNNTIIGFGNADGSIGSIRIRNAENAEISGNLLEDFTGTGINIYVDNKNLKVTGNTIKNPATATSFGIQIASYGNSQVEISKNQIYSDRDKNKCLYGIRFNVASLVNVVDNFIDADTEFYATTRALMNKTATTDFGSTYGYNHYKGLDANQVVKYVCTDTVIRGLGTSGFPFTITVDGTAGTNVLTLNTGTNLYPCLEGMEITIAGAGVAGADLTTVVTERNNNTMYIADNIETTVTNAGVTPIGATWTAV